MAFDISERQLDVTPFFPLNGAAFMTYVKRDPALKLHEQMDTAAFGIYKVHAGEMRKVPLPGFLDCDDLTMSDDLNAFDWRCYDQGTEIFFYSHGFKPQKGLRDLINTSSFKSNKVTLRKGSTVIGESPLSTTWWSNPVVPITLNSGGTDSALDLNVPGTIYTVENSGTSRGIKITADSVALVTLGSAVISNTATLASMPCTTFGGLFSAWSCLILGSGQKGWIEANLNTTIQSAAIAIGDGDLPDLAYWWRIHNLKIQTSHANSMGIKTLGQYLKLTSLDIRTSGQIGIHPVGTHITGDDIKIRGGALGGIYSGSNAWHQSWNKLNISNASGDGIYGTFYTTILNSRINNNGGNGVYLTGSNVTIQNSVVTNNGASGVRVQVGTNGFISGNTIVNNLNSGLYLLTSSSSDYAIVENNIFISNDIGIQANNSSKWHLKNNFLLENNVAISIEGNSTDLAWSGQLLIANNTTKCNVTSSGADPGLLHGSCDNQGTSTATKSELTDTSNYFVGLTTDNTNQHTSGGLLSENIQDWFNFDNAWRVWIKPGGTKGRCLAGEICQIFDYSLTPQAAPALHVNGTAVADEKCPTSVYGSQKYKTFTTEALLNAQEISGDYIGNDNGLCEAGESCLFKPHIGAYQTGPLGQRRSCIFESDSGLSGIKIYFDE